MIKGKTESGFEFTVSEDVLNKWKFMRLLSAVKTDATVIVEIVDYLLGNQAEALIEHLGGDPSIEEMNTAVTEIMFAIRDSKSKNS